MPLPSDPRSSSCLRFEPSRRGKDESRAHRCKRESDQPNGIRTLILLLLFIIHIIATIISPSSSVPESNTTPRLAYCAVRSTQTIRFTLAVLCAVPEHDSPAVRPHLSVATERPCKEMPPSPACPIHRHSRTPRRWCCTGEGNTAPAQAEAGKDGTKPEEKMHTHPLRTRKLFVGSVLGERHARGSNPSQLQGGG